MSEEEFALLAAGAALGSLDADDARAFSDALRLHPEWAQRAAADADAAAALAALVDEVAPPSAIRGALLARIGDAEKTVAPVATEHVGMVPIDESPAAESGATTTTPRASTPARQLRRRWFALAAAVVLVAVLGTGTILLAQQALRPAATVALARIEAAPDAERATASVEGGGPATLHWSVSVGEAVLVTGQMPTLAEGKTFELWYVRGAEKIPAGTFSSAGDTTSAKLKAGMHAGDVIAVTVEQVGGSPTGTPTTPPILAIPTA